MVDFPSPPYGGLSQSEVDEISGRYVPTQPSRQELLRWICDLCPRFRIGLTLAPDGARLAFARLIYQTAVETHTQTFEAKGEDAEDDIILSAAVTLRKWLGLPVGPGQGRAQEYEIAQARARGDTAQAEFLEQQLIRQRMKIK